MVEANSQQNLQVNVNKFSGMAFVGIKKIEYFIKDNDTTLFEDLGDLLTNRNYNDNNLMINYFAVKSFGSEKVDKLDSLVNFNDDGHEHLIRNNLKKAALFDLSILQETIVGQLHILIAADFIMYWDNTGSYIQPTSDQTIISDLDEIIKSIPTVQNIMLYTNKVLPKLNYDHIDVKSVFEIPFTQNLWVNQPSFQETFGTLALVSGVAILAGIYGINNWQNTVISKLNSQITVHESEMIDDNYYTSALTDLQNFEVVDAYSGLKSMVLKDISNSLNSVDFKLKSLKIVNDSENSNILDITIFAKENQHLLFTEQEEMAQKIIDASVSISAIKKESSEKVGLVLNAIVDLDQFKEKINNLKKEQEND